MDYKVNKIKLAPEQAQQKIKFWCAYQERSQHETRQKLLSYGLALIEVDNIIVNLIEENYINEERFAIAYAGGKLRIKHWGKNRIKVELKKHRISDYCLNKALNSISFDEYNEVIAKVIEKKIRTLKAVPKQKLYYSILNYLVSRGFESDLVREKLSNFEN